MQGPFDNLEEEDISDSRSVDSIAISAVVASDGLRAGSLVFPVSRNAAVETISPLGFYGEARFIAGGPPIGLGSSNRSPSSVTGKDDHLLVADGRSDTENITEAFISRSDPFIIQAWLNSFDGDTRPTDTQHVDENIRLCRSILSTTPVGHHGRASALQALVDALYIRCRVVANQDLLQEAIDVAREVVQLRIDGSCDHSSSLVQLGDILCTMHEQFGFAEPLEEALALQKCALAAADAGCHTYARASGGLGWALLYKFEQDGNVTDLDEALRLLRKAVTTDDDSVFHWIASVRLGTALYTNCLLRQTPESLEDAIPLLEAAFIRLPTGHEDRGCASLALCSSYTILYCFSDNWPAFVGAVQAASTMFEEIRVDHPSRPHALARLGRLCKSCLQLSALRVYYDKGISLLREAMQTCPRKCPRRWFLMLRMRASLVESGFSLFHQLADLDDVVDGLRDAIHHAPTGHPFALANHRSLVELLGIQFRQSGSSHDLNAIMAFVRQASILEEHDPSFPMNVEIFVDAIWRCFASRGPRADLQELDRAIGLIKRALKCPGVAAAISTRLTTLGTLLRRRYGASGRASDLENSISYHRKAVVTCPFVGTDQECTFHPRALSELAMSLVDRFKRTRLPSDLDEALRILEEAQNTCSPTTQYRMTVVLHFGIGLLVRYGFLRNCEDLTRSTVLLTQAVGDLSSPIMDRFEHAVRWTKEATSVGLSETGLLAHRHVVEMLSQIGVHAKSMKDQLEALSQALGLACDAANFALSVSEVKTAVELLEHGRAVAWTQSLQLKTPPEGIPQPLAERFVNLSRQLDFSDPAHLTSPASRGASVIAFESLVKEIRNLPGHARFRHSKPFASLAQVARDGPVVLLVPSSTYCNAIVLRSSQDPQQITLPTVNTEYLHSLTGIIRGHVPSANDTATDRAMKVVSHAWPSANGRDVLGELWVNIVKPIIDCLGLKRRPDGARPRLWWCPAGPFAFIPLHAAGSYSGQQVDCTSDYVVSSYTPTLNALLNARKRSSSCSTRPNTTLVALPSVDGLPHLPSISQETVAVTDILSPSTTITSHVTVQAVLNQLRTTNILHLACHGRQVQNDPLQSGFDLCDGRLTVSKLIQVSAPGARLAFLSACESASGDRGQPDETIGLATVMLFVGFQSVIGTMWSMGDADGPFVAREVYSSIIKNGQLDLKAVSYALDSAARRLRLEGVSASRWATYVHIGA